MTVLSSVVFGPFPGAVRIPAVPKKGISGRMKTSVPKLSPVGASFLKPGDTAIHFYYSENEQGRFASLLQDALNRGVGVVVASVGERHPLLNGALHAPRFPRQRNLVRLQVTPDLRDSIASATQAVNSFLQRGSEVRLLIDFDGLVSSESIFDIEAELGRSIRNLRVLTVSQYDGNAFPASVTIEQFQTHALTVVGNIFYSENRKHITPEEYVARRARKTRVAMAAGRST